MENQGRSWKSCGTDLLSSGKDWILEQILPAVGHVWRGKVKGKHRKDVVGLLGGAWWAPYWSDWAFEDEAHPGKFLSLWCGSFMLLVQEGESLKH